MRTLVAVAVLFATGCWTDSSPKQTTPAPATPPAPAPSSEPQGGEFASLTGTGDISSGFDDTNIYGGLTGDDADANGGFGVKGGVNGSNGTNAGSGSAAGTSSGGGGTGWGTIGTGRYGTIGHGSGTSGTGSGYGVGGGRGGMRGRSAVPTTSIGQPNASSAGLDKAIIRRYIKRNIQKLQYCYEKILVDKPTLAGTVTSKFTIAANGHVTASTAGGFGDPNVEGCIAQVIHDIEFPKPKDGKPIDVVYPFTFRPAGS